MNELRRIFGVVTFFAILPLVWPTTNLVVAQPEPPQQQQQEQINPSVEMEAEVPVSTVTLMSHPGCPPCRKFVSDCKKALEDAGWKVVVVYEHKYRTTPTFEIVLATDPDVTYIHVGYRSRASFFKYLNSLGVTE